MDIEALRPCPVLLVDDDAHTLLAIEGVLTGLPLELTRVRSGEAALRALLGSEFALMVLDVNLPGIDGFETARLVRQASRTRMLPIIFLTGNDDLTRAPVGYASGAVDYLLKPVLPEILRAKVSTFVDLYRKTQRLLGLERHERERQLAEQASRHESELLQARLDQERSNAAALAAANARLAEALDSARRALEARDQFLRMASHELKTPLTSLRLTLHNVLRRESPPDADKVARVLNVVNAQTLRLQKLVDELLSVVVLEAGQLRISFEDVNVAAIVRRTVEALDPLVQSAHCAVTVDGPASVRALCDPFWLEQAVTNLLTNATKFGAGAPVEVTVTEHDGSAVIRVVDHGIGLADTDRARLFDPFVRGVSADHYGGLGLGLFIVKQVVDCHGGRVDVASGPEGGAAFEIVLPLQPEAAVRASGADLQQLG